MFALNTTTILVARFVRYTLDSGIRRKRVDLKKLLFLGVLVISALLNFIGAFYFSVSTVRRRSQRLGSGREVTVVVVVDGGCVYTQDEVGSAAYRESSVAPVLFVVVAARAR